MRPRSVGASRGLNCPGTVKNLTVGPGQPLGFAADFDLFPNDRDQCRLRCWQPLSQYDSGDGSAREREEGQADQLVHGKSPFGPAEGTARTVFQLGAMAGRNQPFPVS